ncbi:molybdenum metabolism regulator [Sorangium cellulosum]|uniref:Molybdenum metabolism regulator n=1 Tax=Sorangium cellulosum TaxID=56 RepID=A0A4V0ND31_SORCE|nr:WGR domain-containing protein [Sorangium cellulosum]AUX21252.1 molybdenum metabolism regulator [Sorangium cellulosum]
MRRFEFVQGTSAKFWMAGVDDRTFIVVYGRLGTAGQRKEKAFPTAEAATRELEKKIAEKLREGYQEVAVSAGGAPAGGAPAASADKAAPPPPKLDLPPRVRAGKATEAQRKAAVHALSALAAARGRRSWALGRAVRRARRALSALGGVDPAADAALSAAIDALMARVVAQRAPDRLPLVRAIELLSELDAAAFARAVRETWKAPPETSPAAAALALLARQLEELGDPELGLRLGALLVDRPGCGSMSTEAGWALRWKVLAPHLEAHLAGSGRSLKDHLARLDAGGDAHVAERIARMRAA